MSANIISGLVISVISGLLLWIAYLPHEDSLSASLDSMYWPRVVLWASLMFSLALVAAGWWHRVEPAGPENRARTDKTTDRAPIPSLLCCAAYFFALAWLGFLVSTLLFCSAFAAVLGYRDWQRLVAFSFGVTVTMWLLVIKLMHVSLPRGVWVFREFSLLFY